ncbi:reverse transcriptase domain-containing protein [Tanacetum coccineum]
MDSGSRNSLQTDKETHSGTPNAGCTKGKGGANHIPSRDQGSYQRSLNDRKGRQAIANVLSESCPTRAGDQLHLYGKISISLAQRKQTAEKMVPDAGLILDKSGRSWDFTYAMKVNGSYVAKESGMVQYLEKVKTLARNFKEFSIKQVPRSENKNADALSKIASTSFTYLSKQVLMEELKEKSIHEKECSSL